MLQSEIVTSVKLITINHRVLYCTGLVLATMFGNHIVLQHPSCWGTRVREEGRLPSCPGGIPPANVEKWDAGPSSDPADSDKRLREPQHPPSALGLCSGQPFRSERQLFPGFNCLAPQDRGLWNTAPTTAKLTQAVASCVRVASSSCSCIFFSSFLEGKWRESS